MLENTFQHIPGIGAKKEQLLWKQGVLNWKDLELKFGLQVDLFGYSKELMLHINESRRALNEGDVDYFASRLPLSEHFRILSTFPKHALFLDIETTGLSKYYDEITLVGWSTISDFGVYIKGEDPTILKESLAQAKIIVTFNGSIFDIPFLRKEFPDLHIPICHIDLRFFSKRFGYSGGQKSIEKELGLERIEELTGIDGELAPLLWHQYRWGNIEALKKLVLYNYADLHGMKGILDKVCLGLKAKLAATPLKMQPMFTGHNVSPNSAIEKINANPSTYISFHENRRGPRILLSDLKIDEGFTVVGIDLTGSDARATGWCLLKKGHAVTKRINDFEDIISATIECSPDIISIDSPLSIPKGRTTVFDTDPGRDEFGIMRICERILKKRGVNVYPALIPSMQKLTLRGMSLADRFRKLGYAVIESFPGAAQDILDIPRKRTSEEYLKRGLNEFGIEGNYVHEKVSHDELDAITSALVGLFYWSGYFEALGNEDEDYLIIPSLERNKNAWGQRKVIGISGGIATGKTVAGRFLEQSGFAYGRFSQVIESILLKEGKPANREQLQELGMKIHKDFGQRWLCKELIALLPSNQNLVIDGLRFPEDHSCLKEIFGPDYFHLHLNADLLTRESRYIINGHSREDFIKAVNHEVESNTEALSKFANLSVNNTSNLSDFYRALDSPIFKIK